MLVYQRVPNLFRVNPSYWLDWQKRMLMTENVKSQAYVFFVSSNLLHPKWHGCLINNESTSQIQSICDLQGLFDFTHQIQ